MRALKYIPNILTLSRALLCPFLIYFATRQQWLPTLLLFGLACATDFLDGYTAKKFNAFTKLGSLLDPLCDKLFSIALFSLLMTKNFCPAWFLGLQISVALLQSFGLVVLKVPGGGPKSSFSPLRIGKWNTGFQFAWVGLLLIDLASPRLNLNQPTLLLGYCFLASAQILVFFRYFFRFRLLLLRHLSPRLTPHSAAQS